MNYIAIAGVMALLAALFLVMIFVQSRKNEDLRRQLQGVYDKLSAYEKPGRLLPYGATAGHLVQFGHVWLRTAGFGGIDFINFMPYSNGGAEVLLGDGKTVEFDYDSARCLEAWMQDRANAEEDFNKPVATEEKAEKDPGTLPAAA